MIQHCIKRRIFLAGFEDEGNMVSQMPLVFVEAVCVGEEKGEHGGVFLWDRAC